MNDETKEILENIWFRLHCDSPMSKKYGLELEKNECKILLDYITNLQQENERLKQPQVFIDTQDMEERYGEELYKDYLKEQLKDYKSRLEKAIEYIKTEKYVSADENCEIIAGYRIDYLLNILQGEE